MKIIRSIAAVSGEDVFGVISFNTLKNENQWDKWASSPSVVELENNSNITPGWGYSNNSFTAPDTEIQYEKPEDVEKGFAMILDGIVFDIFWTNNTEIGKRWEAGLSSNPKFIVIPEDDLVLVGDKWDGNSFISSN